MVKFGRVLDRSANVFWFSLRVEQRLGQEHGVEFSFQVLTLPQDRLKSPCARSSFALASMRLRRFPPSSKV